MLSIETLNRGHDRSGFDCGNEALNQYLRNIAQQHLNKGMSRIFVVVDGDTPTEILGFFTLASCEIFVDKLPRKYAKKYPSRVPAAKLARLAVARKRQKQGLGTRMMINAIERVISVSQNLGIIGFFVDAKDNEAKEYYEQFGFIPLPDNPLELFLPLATLRNAYDTILTG
jgi:GNAT superfamily N-acetyltransferase